MSPRLPPQAQLARWAVKYGPLVLPYAKRLYDQGRFRQLAIMHARTIDGGTFSWEMVDGERVWVVWSGEGVVASYPDRPDLLERPGHPFPAARPERRQSPHEVATQRAKRRLADLPLPGTGRASGTQDDVVPEMDGPSGGDRRADASDGVDGHDPDLPRPPGEQGD